MEKLTLQTVLRQVSEVCRRTVSTESLKSVARQQFLNGEDGRHLPVEFIVA